MSIEDLHKGEIPDDTPCFKLDKECFTCGYNIFTLFLGHVDR